ncbi:hypothetical protein HDV02_002513 [Globomyces sp. JEL0801]|nr:hypothetical protein HDV02_002513 [Globomyces sp. JEL0801]
MISHRDFNDLEPMEEIPFTYQNSSHHTRSSTEEDRIFVLPPKKHSPQLNRTGSIDISIDGDYYSFQKFPKQEEPSIVCSAFERDEINQDDVEAEGPADIESNIVHRSPFFTRARLFTFTYYTLILAFIYFVMVGFPLWNGVVLNVKYYTSDDNGFIIFAAIALTYAYLPLLFTRFEDDPPENVVNEDIHVTALLIPCYKAEAALGYTLKAALKIFPAKNIFVLDNGNNPVPFDGTPDIHAEYVGIQLTENFKYVMLIDDDVILPANLPLKTDLLVDKVGCVGYAIGSTGSDGSLGNYVQQSQDLEYKLSGFTKTFQSKYGSVTFPHGAVILWKRETIMELFKVHPCYNISEDWFFGHVARTCGHRIKFCSQVFLKTETPHNFIFSSGGRGGYGETTVFRQRFYRWNFFHVKRIYENLHYFVCCWKLGIFELVTKFYVLQEIYTGLMWVFAPIMLPMLLIAAPIRTIVTTFAIMGGYLLGLIFFNAYHLRRKNQMVSWKIFPYYLGYKFTLNFINIVSVSWSMYEYGKYFAKQHIQIKSDSHFLKLVEKVIFLIKLIG